MHTRAGSGPGLAVPLVRKSVRDSATGRCLKWMKRAWAYVLGTQGTAWCLLGASVYRRSKSHRALGRPLLDSDRGAEEPATLHTWTQCPACGGPGPGGCRGSGASWLFLAPERPRAGWVQGHTGQPSASGLLPPPCGRDLKRDVAKKLEKLEKRTQRAIAELIRECSLGGGSLPSGGHRPGPLSPLLSAVCPGERLKGQEDSLASAVDATNEQEACDSD